MGGSSTLITPTGVVDYTCDMVVLMKQLSGRSCKNNFSQRIGEKHLKLSNGNSNRLSWTAHEY